MTFRPRRSERRVSAVPPLPRARSGSCTRIALSDRCHLKAVRLLFRHPRVTLTLVRDPGVDPVASVSKTDGKAASTELRPECAGRDSNPHARRQRVLNTPCLPFHPPARSAERGGVEPLALRLQPGSNRRGAHAPFTLRSGCRRSRTSTLARSRCSRPVSRRRDFAIQCIGRRTSRNRQPLGLGQRSFCPRRGLAPTTPIEEATGVEPHRRSGPPAFKASWAPVPMDASVSGTRRTRTPAPLTPTAFQAALHPVQFVFHVTLYVYACGRRGHRALSARSHPACRALTQSPRAEHSSTRENPYDRCTPWSFCPRDHAPCVHRSPSRG